MNIGFHLTPSSRSGTRPLPAPPISPSPRSLRDLCVSVFSSPDLLPFNSRLLALSAVEGSTACPVYPACPEPRREERREHSRRVNLLSLRLLPAVDCKLSAVSCLPFFTNSHRITSFANPHPLTPIESHLCKKQGEGVPMPRAVSQGPHVPARHAATPTTPFLSCVYFITRGHPRGGGTPVQPVNSRSIRNGR